MRRIILITVVLVLVIAAAVWVFQSRSAAGPILLKKRITVFPSNRWRLDWSWKVGFRRGGRRGVPLVAEIKALGGVAFRDAGGGDPIQLPEVGFLSIVLGQPEPETIDAITIGLHDGTDSDLEPIEGISILSPGIYRDTSIPQQMRVSIPLSQFRPSGARLGKINIMNQSNQAVTVSILDVSLLPADVEAEMRITQSGQ